MSDGKLLPFPKSGLDTRLPPIPRSPYPFVEKFERAVVLAECSSPRFHARIGYALDPDRMNSPIAKRLIRAAQHAAKERGKGCKSPLQVIQQIRKGCEQGNVTFDELNECDEYISAAEDELTDSLDVDGLVELLKSTVREIRHREVVNTIVQDTKAERVKQSARDLSTIAAIGDSYQPDGGDIGVISSTMFEEESIETIGTGIAQLDATNQAKLPVGALGLAIAETGVGKTFYLCQLAAHAYMSCHDVLIISLEMSVAGIAKRIMANLLDMTADELRSDPFKMNERRKMIEDEGVGSISILRYPPRSFTPNDLRTVIEDLVLETKRRPRVIVVDYADKMVSKVGSEKRSYDDRAIVYEQLIDLAKDVNGWVWTASQKARDGKVSDSLEKARLASVIVEIFQTKTDEENDTTQFRVLKNRDGEAHVLVGPLARDCAHGRIAMLAENSYFPWADR